MIPSLSRKCFTKTLKFFVFVLNNGRVSTEQKSPGSSSEHRLLVNKTQLPPWVHQPGLYRPGWAGQGGPTRRLSPEEGMAKPRGTAGPGWGRVHPEMREGPSYTQKAAFPSWETSEPQARSRRGCSPSSGRDTIWDDRRGPGSRKGSGKEARGAALSGAPGAVRTSS